MLLPLPGRFSLLPSPCLLVHISQESSWQIWSPQCLLTPTVLYHGAYLPGHRSVPPLGWMFFEGNIRAAASAMLNTYLLNKHSEWMNEWGPIVQHRMNICLPKRPKPRLFFMSWSKLPKTTGNASVSNERLTDGDHLAVKGLMSTISPPPPTQAGQTQMPAERDPAPQWSLSPITQFGMSVSFKIEKEIDVGFTFIPHHVQKSICWPISVSIHFCLYLCPSWDWRADHESANPFPMVSWACSYTALINWVSCGLGAEKN